MRPPRSSGAICDYRRLLVNQNICDSRRLPDSTLPAVPCMFLRSFESSVRKWVSLLYRVVAFGKPHGPWRARERQAEADAVAAGLAEYDEWGALYFDAFAQIEWAREDDLRLSA